MVCNKKIVSIVSIVFPPPQEAFKILLSFKKETKKPMARSTAAKAAFNHAIGNMSVHQKDVLIRISPC